MQPSIADSVYAAINGGLALRDRLEAGEPLPWELERATLKQALSAFAPEAGDPLLDGQELIFSEHGSLEERDRLTRATIRYALTCWLDEWFTQHPTLATRWRERTLESELFGSNQGNAKFWDEARYAETRGDLDALEAIFLCAMLGFRGAWRDKPAQLDVWATRVGVKLQQAASTWTMPASLEPTHREAQDDDLPQRRMAFSVLLTFSLLLPLVLALWWRG